MVRHSPRMMSSWKKATQCTYIQMVLLISSEALRRRSLWLSWEALVDAQKLTMEEQGIMLNNLIENCRADPEQPGGESEQMDDILVIGVHA